MASLTPISQSQSFFNKTQFKLPATLSSNFLPKKAGKVKKRHLLKTKGFVKEMRLVAMKLYTRDQAIEGEKDWPERPMAKWDPTVDGYLKFLVDRKLVYDTLEGIVEKAHFSSYVGFRNTGLERSEKLAKDLEWFKEHGCEIPSSDFTIQ